LPQSLFEVLLWIAAPIAAGICEEMAFRDYVQRGFQALSETVAFAVLAQGIVFGLFRFYQGWENVTVIGVLGALFVALAAWDWLAHGLRWANESGRVVRLHVLS
jgi:membrane protease YdiL (CAAX protease family)